MTLAALGPSADFVVRLGSAAGQPPRARTGVVFTGQFDRITLGLALLSQGAVERLFISGVNAGAGLDPARFAAQFALPPALVDALARGTIVLAEDAGTTLENAVETACWVTYVGDRDGIVLVTSRTHAPRAGLALARALPAGIRVAYAVPDPHDPVPPSLWAAEFVKFAATWLVTLLPRAVWSARSPRTCEAP